MNCSSSSVVLTTIPPRGLSSPRNSKRTMSGNKFQNCVERIPGKPNQLGVLSPTPHPASQPISLAQIKTPTPTIMRSLCAFMGKKREGDEDNTKNGKIKEEEILKILDLMFINMRVSVLLFLNFHFSLNHFISFRMMFFHGKPLHERFLPNFPFLSFCFC